MQDKDADLNEIKLIGLRIAYFRKIRNMTQAALAEAVHINKNYLSHIENGSSGKTLLISIAKARDVELSVLVDFSEVKDSQKEIRRQVAEFKVMINELKQLDNELNDIMAQMNDFDFTDMK